ncbi:hypothetical protein pb186bvf_015216 [Paramecium bursaria]
MGKHRSIFIRGIKLILSSPALRFFELSRQSSQRSQSAPSNSSFDSKQHSQVDVKKLKKSGYSLLKKVFQDVIKILKCDQEQWRKIYFNFVSDGYEDLNQAQLARVSDLITQYNLSGKEAIYLYLELQKEFRKQNGFNQFYPTREEIKSISEEILNSLLRQPAEIRFQSSQKNNLPLNLIILFGPQNSGKTTFISACINFIRGLEYHSLLRYTVQKNERVIRIDNANEQLCFIKAQSFTNPYENKDFATKLIEVLEQEAQGRQLASFSILYFAISTQTRIGLAEKYQIQKLLELIPQKMQKFFIVKTFCTDDKANMTLFTGKESPASRVPQFIQEYVLYDNTPIEEKETEKVKEKQKENENEKEKDKAKEKENKKENEKDNEKEKENEKKEKEKSIEKYIFNNKLLSYEYKNNQNNQNVQNQPHIPQNSNSQTNLNQQNQQQQDVINQEQEQQHLNPPNQEQASQTQSVILELSIDNVDTTNVYWERNKKNYVLLSEDIKKLHQGQSDIEYNIFKQHLKSLQTLEQQVNKFMITKKQIVSKQKLMTEKIEELQTVKTQIQTLYLTVGSKQVQIIMRNFANSINILICTQCEQICHQACSSKQDNISGVKYDIPDCNRFKQGFCKSCYKNKNSYCKPVKHKLEIETKVKDSDTTVLHLDTKYFETKQKQRNKEDLIKQVRLLQMENFEITKKYAEDVKLFKQQQDAQVLGYLSINFEIYKKVFEQNVMKDDGLIFQSVINDILEK